MQITKNTYAKFVILLALSNVAVEAFFFSNTPTPQSAPQNNTPPFTPKFPRCEVPGMAGTHPFEVCSIIKEIKKIGEDIKNGIPAPEDTRYDNVLVLEGPTGVGKTKLAAAIAKNANCHFYEIYGADVPNRFVGGSKDFINKQIEIAIAEGKARKQPVIIFFDGIDVFSGNEQSTARTEYDAAYSAIRHYIDKNKDNSHVFFIFAIGDLESLPVQLKERFYSSIISIPKPDAEQRKALLHYFSKKHSKKDLAEYCSSDCIEQLIKKTENFSARNIEDMCFDANTYASDQDEPVDKNYLMYALREMKAAVER
jgi:ATP-dependent 26S proteasome regulatory subunit